MVLLLSERGRLVEDVLRELAQAEPLGAAAAHADAGGDGTCASLPSAEEPALESAPEPAPATGTSLKVES